MNIVNGKRYRIQGSSAYFRGKYGTPNPEIVIEDRAEVVLGTPVMEAAENGNPAAMLFANRVWHEGLPGGVVYYGKVKGMGECVTDKELEEIK